MHEQAFEIEPLPPFFEEFAERFGAKEQYVIDSDSKAEWAIKTIRKSETETERKIKACDDQIAFYQEQKRRFDQAGRYDTAHLLHLLQAFTKTVTLRETKAQYAYDLPSGSLIQKKPTIAYERDDALLLAYFKENAPEYVKTKESPDWDGFKKARLFYSGEGEAVADSETGECVPGVTVIENPGGFSIKAAKGAT